LDFGGTQKKKTRGEKQRDKGRKGKKEKKKRKKTFN